MLYTLSTQLLFSIGVLVMFHSNLELKGTVVENTKLFAFGLVCSWDVFRTSLRTERTGDSIHQAGGKG